MKEYIEKDKKAKMGVREGKMSWMVEKAERAQHAQENGRQKELNGI